MIQKSNSIRNMLPLLSFGLGIVTIALILITPTPATGNIPPINHILAPMVKGTIVVYSNGAATGNSPPVLGISHTWTFNRDVNGPYTIDMWLEDTKTGAVLGYAPQIAGGNSAGSVTNSVTYSSSYQFPGPQPYALAYSNENPDQKYLLAFKLTTDGGSYSYVYKTSFESFRAQTQTVIPFNSNPVLSFVASIVGSR